MRLVIAAAALGLLLGLSACAPSTDEARTTQEAGGTIPWNRPQSWEGGGALGSQINEMNH